MTQEYSFDVVSQYDRQELVNAVNQAQREVTTRYDFKDAGASIALGDSELVLDGPSEMKLKAMVDVLQSKLVRRNLSLKILKMGPVEPAAKGTVRQRIELQAGITDELARTLVKQIKAVSPKVQPRIQGDAIRVSSREKDLLQKVIQSLRETDAPVPLQFINYR
ncbi:MAG TPA: YajQ family cyclic di-GMP-binding protein [Candidatus Eisenbacteria bacterium]|nr:YajQ family cyclic di-GMP-binding protein [Candidatus Eisenbacteria bacterium]